jgi:hypothetical protein
METDFFDKVVKKYNGDRFRALRWFHNEIDGVMPKDLFIQENYEELQDLIDKINSKP